MKNKYERLLFSAMVTVVCLCVSLRSCYSAKVRKDCLGSDLTISGSGNQQYASYKRMYENCTHVTKSLVITHLSDNPDLSFLSDIQEVFGSVLISLNTVPVIPLRSLVVIRGSVLYSPFGETNGSYSLYIGLNSGSSLETDGLQEIQLTSLQEILAGDVMLLNNKQMCFENTITWQYILNRPDAQVTIKEDIRDKDAKIQRCTGIKCHDQCTMNGVDRFCWGKGPDMCQMLTSLNCSSFCTDRGMRCFEAGDRQCCHEECAGGCTGYTNQDCLACLHYEDGHRCVERCPLPTIYNTAKRRIEPNPNFKYHYNAQCVTSCSNMKTQGEYCVSQCSSEYIDDEEGRNCITCNDTCKKVVRCTPEGWVSGNNINTFIGCTHAVGAIKIQNVTFQGHPASGKSGITLDQLKAFESLEEITDYLQVDAYIENFTSLSFFKKLKIISGQVLNEKQRSLSIMGTSLEYIGLTALKEIRKGKIGIEINKHLCYADSFDYKNLFPTTTQLKFTRENSAELFCAENNHTCSDRCSSNSCWGPTDVMCWACKGPRVEGRCLNVCNSQSFGHPVYNSSNRDVVTCKRCHQECLEGCKGDGPGDCLGNCSNFEDRYAKECVAKCPAAMYPDDYTKCQPCSHDCSGGCTGGVSNLKKGGCNRCHQFVLHAVINNTFLCLPEETINCSVGFYPTLEPYDVLDQSIPKSTTQVVVCRQCHSECLSCKHEGDGSCDKDSCVHYEQQGRCVPACEIDFYNESNKRCHKCTADTKHDNCIKLSSQISDSQKRIALTSSLVVLLVVIIVAVVIIVVARRYYRKQKQRLIIADDIPLNATNASPDLSSLRLIKESELRRGSSIGSGAFGTVYKGVWIPHKEKVRIPVAIKVLTEGVNTNLNVELLDEARVMASVRHIYCIRIIAVCMTAPMQLVTPLMACGSLLDYIRKHRSNIGSQSLLTWSAQIAKGMEYLETRGIVHRDLAARNVLVESPNRVRITDFGLAKLLDHQVEAFHSDGGKMPIKWLALECIEHRIYTHKSDVWSYGVTLWEMYTYGRKPFEDLKAREIPDILEKGERLPQPDICTIDVYMLMVKCWMLEADNRPSFKELAAEFTKMASDPGRFLVITGDKLMRLQSVVRNSGDLIREISGLDLPEDGSEECVSAEDYLGTEDLKRGGTNASPVTLNSITEESEYINGNSLGSMCNEKDEDDAPGIMKRGISTGYIDEPVHIASNAGQKSTLPALKMTGQIKREPKTDESGYLEVPSISGAGEYIEDGDLNSPNLNEPEYAKDSYLDMDSRAGVNNPDYYSPQSKTVSKNTRQPGNLSDSKKTTDLEQNEYCNVSRQKE